MLPALRRWQLQSSPGPANPKAAHLFNLYMTLCVKEPNGFRHLSAARRETLCGQPPSLSAKLRSPFRRRSRTRVELTSDTFNKLGWVDTTFRGLRTPSRRPASDPPGTRMKKPFQKLSSGLMTYSRSHKYTALLVACTLGWKLGALVPRDP